MELDVVIERLANLKEENDKSHADILTQVMKTNGHVASLKVWRGYITGAVAVIVVLIIPMALMLFSSFLEKK